MSSPRLIDLPVVTEDRGSITFVEVGQTLPFTPLRSFMVYDVPAGQIRGDHAHRECHQLLICVCGRLTARTDDGAGVQERTLDSPARGLYMPPLTWGGQYDFSPGAVLLVLASHKYDAAEYIRDYGEFIALLKQPRSSPPP